MTSPKPGGGPSRPVPPLSRPEPARVNTSPARDKRARPRTRRRYIVTVAAHPWFTTDVGLGGFGAEATVLPALGTRFTGLIRGKDAEVPFSAQVVWAVQGNMYLHQRSRVGVRFIRVAPALAGLLDAERGPQPVRQPATPPPGPSQVAAGPPGPAFTARSA